MAGDTSECSKSNFWLILWWRVTFPLKVYNYIYKTYPFLLQNTVIKGPKATVFKERGSGRRTYFSKQVFKENIHCKNSCVLAVLWGVPNFSETEHNLYLQFIFLAMDIAISYHFSMISLFIYKWWIYCYNDKQWKMSKLLNLIRRVYNYYY